jgi:hypothetical protein
VESQAIAAIALNGKPGNQENYYLIGVTLLLRESVRMTGATQYERFRSNKFRDTPIYPP